MLSFVFSVTALILVIGNKESKISCTDETNTDLYVVLVTTVIRSITPQMISDLLFGPSLLTRDESRIRCEQQFYVTTGSAFLIRKIIACLQFINTADNDRAEAYALSALHTSQGYSRTVTHQLWKLTRLFSKPSNNVHASIIRQTLSVEILMESAEWKRLAQNITPKSSHILHNSTALLQHNENMRPQTIFSEFVVLKQFRHLLDLYISKANCHKELESLELVVERAKLSPIVHWYIVIAIIADAIKRQVHSNTLEQWLSMEQMIFSKISIVSNCNTQLSKSRSEQILILRKIGLLSFSCSRKAQMSFYLASLRDFDSLLNISSRKNKADVDTARNFCEGRSRAHNAGSEGYREVQCVEVLLEAADGIEKRLEFIFGNLALNGAWRVWVNTSLLQYQLNNSKKQHTKTSINSKNNLKSSDSAQAQYVNPFTPNTSQSSTFTKYNNTGINQPDNIKLQNPNQGFTLSPKIHRNPNSQGSLDSILKSESDFSSTDDSIRIASLAIDPKVQKGSNNLSSVPLRESKITESVRNYLNQSSKNFENINLQDLYLNQSKVHPSDSYPNHLDSDKESAGSNRGSRHYYDDNYSSSDNLDFDDEVDSEYDSNGGDDDLFSDDSFNQKERDEEQKILLESKHSLKLSILKHLCVLRQGAVVSAGSHVLSYISMYQQLSSQAILEEL
ncbi:hypothetical protein AYI68_g1748 [Smittium mucronatum]|uniref:Uncharacterized protein n=1 Tax=Smittium mucronatum TaxID=133383 RepID=A0A1R0H4R9_9FUNG|nr:hypothetical protein AYI68_g1748 [Smittium mucronatum]